MNSCPHFPSVCHRWTRSPCRHLGVPPIILPRSLYLTCGFLPFTLAAIPSPPQQTYIRLDFDQLTEILHELLRLVPPSEIRVRLTNVYLDFLGDWRLDLGLIWTGAAPESLDRVDRPHSVTVRICRVGVPSQ